MLRNTSPLPHKLSILLLGIILLIALVARLRYLDQIEHNIDHAYPVWQAMTTLENDTFPLKGQGTSVLFANPALTGFLFIPAIAFTRSLIGVYVFIILLNTLGVWMTYRDARSLIGDRLALLAAGLLAVNPWMIEYSRTSWVQSLLPFFIPAVAWLLWPVLLSQSYRPDRRVLLALIVATLLTQTYLLAFFIVAPVGVLLLIFRNRVPWRAVAAGVGVFVVATLLYGAALLNDTDDLNTRIDNFTSNDPHFTREAWDSAVRLVTGAEYAIARGLQAPADDANYRHNLSQMGHYALLAAIIIGIGGAVWSIIRHGERRDEAIIALVWFGLPILAMSYTGSPVHPFYQILSIPGGYVLAAWGLGIIAEPGYRRTGDMILAVAFVPFAILMLTNSARYYQETKVIPGAHQMGALSIEYGVKLGEAIQMHREPGQIVFADEAEWIMNSFAQATFPVVRDTRSPALTMIPPNGALYVQFGTESPAPLTGTLAKQIDMPDKTAILIYTLPPAQEADLPGTQLNIPTQQGLTLASYELEQTDNEWILQTVWRIDHIEPEVLHHTYSPFIHLFDADGQRVSIIDGAGLRGDAWRVGWLLVYQMPFSLPAGAPEPFSLRIGQFDGMQNANVIFLPDDNPSVVVELPEQVRR